jgi:hypothetical protein
LNRPVRLIAGFVFSAFAAISAACDRELSVAQRQQWHADSLRYLADLAVWTHDSVVIDSIILSAIRSAHADSMWSLQRNMIRSVAPMRFPQLIECESQRLERLFGPRIADEIKRRAKRDAIAVSTDSQISLMNRRLPTSMGVQIYGDICGRDAGNPPASVDGVSMMGSGPRRPVPPPRPR